MISQWVIVVPVDYLGFDNLWQVQKAFAMQHSIDFLLNFFSAFFPNFASQLVFCL